MLLEAQLLQQLEHPNIVRYKHVSYTFSYNNCFDANYIFIRYIQLRANSILGWSWSETGASPISSKIDSLVLRVLSDLRTKKPLQ